MPTPTNFSEQSTDIDPEALAAEITRQLTPIVDRILRLDEQITNAAATQHQQHQPMTATNEPTNTRFVANVRQGEGGMTKFSTASGVTMSVPTNGDPFECEVVKLARAGSPDAFNAAAQKFPELYNAHVRNSGSGHH